jgi:serine/threonine protein kinase
MTYELLMGKTPFHAYELKDLIAKINKGDYTLLLKEPITIECALFLTQCLQANEEDRIKVSELFDHPFTNFTAENNEVPFTKLDSEAYRAELKSVTETAKLSGSFEKPSDSQDSFEK